MLLLTWMCAACSTSVQVWNPASLQQAETVYISTEGRKAEEDRVADIVAVLKKYGYRVAANPEAADLALRFRFANGLRMAATLELWRKNELLLKVDSVNEGFGTLIARPAARAGRIDAALEAFDDKLAKLRPVQRSYR